MHIVHHALLLLQKSFRYLPWCPPLRSWCLFCSSSCSGGCSISLSRHFFMLSNQIFRILLANLQSLRLCHCCHDSNFSSGFDHIRGIQFVLGGTNKPFYVKKFLTYDLNRASALCKRSSMDALASANSFLHAFLRVFLMSWVLIAHASLRMVGRFSSNFFAARIACSASISS